MTSKPHIKKLPIVIATSLVLAALPNSSGYAAPSSSSPRAPKPMCGIHIGNAHISRHELRFGDRRAVIVKAISECNVVQQQVTLTVNIYKVEKFGHPMLNSVSTEPEAPTSSGLIVRNFDNLIDCKNYKRTKYYGIAYAKALINEQWHFAGRTRSPKTMEINCGT